MRVLEIVARVVAVGVGLILLLSGGYLLCEGLYVGVFAGREVVESYRFGSESMISQGGWAYKSKWHFLVSDLLKSLSLLVPAAITIYFGCRRSRSKATRPS